MCYNVLTEKIAAYGRCELPYAYAGEIGTSIVAKLRYKGIISILGPQCKWQRVKIWSFSLSAYSEAQCGTILHCAFAVY